MRFPSPLLQARLSLPDPLTASLQGLGREKAGVYVLAMDLFKHGGDIWEGLKNHWDMHSGN